MPERDSFIDDLLAASPDHDKWVAIVRFGLPTLLDDQRRLVELVIREAGRLELKGTERDAAGLVVGILNELGLRLVPASPGGEG